MVVGSDIPPLVVITANRNKNKLGKKQNYFKKTSLRYYDDANNITDHPHVIEILKYNTYIDTTISIVSSSSQIVIEISPKYLCCWSSDRATTFLPIR